MDIHGQIGSIDEPASEVWIIEAKLIMSYIKKIEALFRVKLDVEVAIDSPVGDRLVVTYSST